MPRRALSPIRICPFERKSPCAQAHGLFSLARGVVPSAERSTSSISFEMGDGAPQADGVSAARAASIRGPAGKRFPIRIVSKR
jgi:hypothetical protein